jgi:hypothetical protein
VPFKKEPSARIGNIFSKQSSLPCRPIQPNFRCHRSDIRYAFSILNGFGGCH